MALVWFGHMPADKACECLRKYHRVAVSSAPERSWEGAGGCRSPQIGGTCRKAKPLLRNQKCVSSLSSRLPRDSAQGRATCAGQIHHSSCPTTVLRRCPPRSSGSTYTGYVGPQHTSRVLPFVTQTIRKPTYFDIREIDQKDPNRTALRHPAGSRRGP